MGRIIAFDSLRFIGCIFIILHHTGINIYGFHGLEWHSFLTAGLAVEIFFVISGFLLAHSYYKNISSGADEGVLCRKYFFNRIKRLYPEYIFALLLSMLLVSLFLHHVSARTFMLNAIMMGDMGGIQTLLGGSWYVAVLFWGGCLLYNLLVLFKDKAVYFILPTISCLCLFYLVNHGNTVSGHSDIDFNFLSKGTIRGLLGLTAGIYCYQICTFLKKANFQVKPKILSVLLFLLEAVAVALTVNAVLVRKSQDVSDFNIYFYISYIVGLLYFRKEKLLKFLSWKIWGKVADISYTVYLTHLILLEIIRVHWKQLSYMNPFYSYTIIVMMSLIFGYICYHAQKFLFAWLMNKLLLPAVTAEKDSVAAGNPSGGVKQ